MALKSTFGLAVVNHNYTEEERQVLNSYQSLEFMPPHSKVSTKKSNVFAKRQTGRWGLQGRPKALFQIFRFKKKHSSQEANQWFVGYLVFSIDHKLLASTLISCKLSCEFRLGLPQLASTAAGPFGLGQVVDDGNDRSFCGSPGVPPPSDHRPHLGGQVGSHQGLHRRRRLHHCLVMDLPILASLPSCQVCRR